MHLPRPFRNDGMMMLDIGLPMGNDQKSEFTEEEQKKRDKLLHKLLTTPPRPREKMKKGKGATVSHAPDCAANNAPADEPGHCTCGAAKAVR